MNRRGFLRTMLRAGVAAAALPAATTYARIWTPPTKLVWRSNMLGIRAQLEACNSIALEVLPFQDQLGQWLSVYMATAKNHLAIIGRVEYMKHFEEWQP